MISACVPLKVIVPSDAPSPAVKVRPVTSLKVNKPFVELRVTVTVVLSTSLMLIALPLPIEKTRLVSSLVDWAEGTVLTGASFTALMVTLTVLVSVKLPSVV